MFTLQLRFGKNSPSSPPVVPSPPDSPILGARCHGWPSGRPAQRQNDVTTMLFQGHMRHPSDDRAQLPATTNQDFDVDGQFSSVGRVYARLGMFLGRVAHMKLFPDICLHGEVQLSRSGTPHNVMQVALFTSRNHPNAPIIQHDIQGDQLL